jgi:hypothetical protein
MSVGVLPEGFKIADHELGEAFFCATVQLPPLIPVRHPQMADRPIELAPNCSPIPIQTFFGEASF